MFLFTLTTKTRVYFNTSSVPNCYGHDFHRHGSAEAVFYDVELTQRQNNYNYNYTYKVYIFDDVGEGKKYKIKKEMA